MAKNIIPTFLIIPYELITNKNLTETDRLLYGVIYWFCNTTKLKKCSAGNALLALLLKKSRGSIVNALTNLEKYKYIKREYSNFARTEIIPLLGGTSNLVGGTLDLVGGVYKSNGHSNNIYSNKNKDIYTHTPEFQLLLKKLISFYQITIAKKTTNKKISLSGVNKVITARLQEYEPIELLRAIQGFSNDAWQMKHNGWRGVKWFFSDSGRISQYIGLFNKQENKNFEKEAKKYLTK